MAETQHTCPQCAAPEDATRPPVTTRDLGVVTVTHLCAEGHIWAVRYVEAD